MAKKKHPENKYDFSSTDLLVYIWHKRVQLIAISFIAAIASILISFTITPKYRSTVIMFPTSSASVSRNLLSDNFSAQSNLYAIGEEEESEQLMQILNSAEIRDRIIKKYNLAEHYEIDTTSKFPLTQLYAEYKSNIKFSLTEYLSVVVDVLDKDPQMAADIANDIASLVDTVYNQMIRQRSLNAMLLVEDEYNIAKENVKELQDSIFKIRALGINEYERQSERLYEGLAQAINEDNPRAVKMFEKRLNLLSEYGGHYANLREQVNMEIQRMQRMKQRYQEARIEAEQKLPHKFLVESAVKAEKKAYPKKSIIVIISTLAAFLLTLITLILTENIKRKV